MCLFDRKGLVGFTVILTIGQLIFAIGGTEKTYWIMVLGRFVFGLGGECMTVAQSAIVSQWFKGNELQFAFGVNLSVARVGSFINGPVVTDIAAPKEGEPDTKVHVGLALFVGLGICIFSLGMAILLAFIDYWAEKKDGVKVELSEDEKFKMEDLKGFCSKERLPYWLVTGSCVAIYMVVFIYISNLVTML